MKFTPRMIVCLLLVLLLLGTNGAAAQAPLPAGFTYQGQLQDGAGNPLNATCDFTFRLWDAGADGTQIGVTSMAPDISVSGGYFTAPVNAAGEFGANAFPGEGRWLEVSVRCPGGSGPYTTLAPRQPLTAAPYASYAPQAGSAPWSGISGLPAGFADGTDDTGSDWHLGGNSIGDPATNFIGSTTNETLLFKVNNQTAFRLEPATYSPNVIGGYGGNSVASGLHGATIGGGGSQASGTNQVLVEFGTVSGGAGNVSNGQYATVGGGNDNTATGNWATVSGGANNTTNDNLATIGGGYGNTASEYAATVSGGWLNRASADSSTVSGGFKNVASGLYASVGGGIQNTAGANYAFAAGHYAEAAHPGAFVWSDASTTITFTSSSANQFLIQSVGGVGVNTNDTLANGVTVDGRVVAGGTATGIVGTEPFVSRGSASGISLDDRSGGTAQRWVIYPNNGALNFWTDSGTNGVRASLSDAGVLSITGLGSAGSATLCRNASNQIATCSSSIRYKTNIAALPLGLEAILQLRPVTFDWKANGEADLGFVAEEVAQISPLLATYNTAGQVEGVKYDRISAVLVNALQEQQQQIAALEAQIASLQQNTPGNATPSPLSTPWPWLALTVITLGGLALARRPGK